MAKQQSVTLVDDLDGGKAAETLRFGLDGVLYDIDLNKRNANALRKVLAKFVGHARKVKPPRSPERISMARGGSVAPTPAQIREWATANGVALSSRGRIPATVLEQYAAANS
ncbi:histone-like nucleoid-structuring protein Lsr2 [Nakamurella sp. GG22]